jgi:hypothetical protein
MNLVKAIVDKKIKQQYTKRTVKNNNNNYGTNKSNNNTNDTMTNFSKVISVDHTRAKPTKKNSEGKFKIFLNKY